MLLLKLQYLYSKNWEIPQIYYSTSQFCFWEKMGKKYFVLLITCFRKVLLLCVGFLEIFSFSLETISALSWDFFNTPLLLLRHSLFTSSALFETFSALLRELFQHSLKNSSNTLSGLFQHSPGDVFSTPLGIFLAFPQRLFQRFSENFFSIPQEFFAALSWGPFSKLL